MTKKSIKKNFIFNIIYQIITLALPLITTPYISRVIGVDGVGEYSYANSIVSYFILVAVLGTTTFGQRAIGYTQNDRESRSRTFWELFVLRAVTSLITLAAYIIFTLIFIKNNQLIYLILSLNIFNVILDITWFYQGMEEFGKTVTSSLIFRFLNLVCIFVFVKDSSDLWIYILISVLQIVLGNLVLWLILPKYLCKVSNIRPFKNIKGVLQLFVPTIATQIYLVLDKSMIGWFSNGYSENGYYEQTEKIIKMTLSVITALGTVMIPRIARCYKEGDAEAVNYYINKSYQIIWMLSLPIMFGLISIASVFVPVFFGEGYEKCAVLMPILSCLTIFIGLSNVTGMQYLVPTGKQNILTLTVVVGAVVNLCLNAVLIPFFASTGAVIASVVAEFSVTLTGFIYLRKKSNLVISSIFKCSIKYWIAGLIMGGSVYVVKLFLPITVWALIVLVLIGVVVYFVMLLILKDSLLLEVLIKLFGKMKAFGNKKVKANAITENILHDSSDNIVNNSVESSSIEVSQPIDEQVDEKQEDVLEELTKVNDDKNVDY